MNVLRYGILTDSSFPLKDLCSVINNSVQRCISLKDITGIRTTRLVSVTEGSFPRASHCRCDSRNSTYENNGVGLGEKARSCG